MWIRKKISLILIMILILTFKIIKANRLIMEISINEIFYCGFTKERIIIYLLSIFTIIIDQIYHIPENKGLMLYSNGTLIINYH